MVQRNDLRCTWNVSEVYITQNVLFPIGRTLTLLSWDQKNLWTGPYLKGHTNLTEIENLGLDLLWRNGIPPDKVVMGFGFYGRSFTMTDTSCSKPPDCTFSGPGFAGDCTQEKGILSYSGIETILWLIMPVCNLL